ncbi:MAG TPA: hypothetical protein VEK39_15295 [Solirubrobacterales bacterium]|nr:hypothetical protein [Solirubrobacterales bacterium]
MPEERTPPDDKESAPESSEETTEPTAPSIGAHTKIDHVPPQERLAGREFSTVDAMGQEKRRGVTGQTYGPTRQRVIMSFVVFFAIVGVVFIGLLFLVDQLDQPPDSNPAQAPWSAPDAPQKPAQPLQ